MTQELEKLREKIGQVRRRFKWIAFAKGLVFSLSGSIVILAVAILLVDHSNYSDAAITLARLGSILCILGVVAWFLLRPLLRKVGDVQIARYIEENNPVLQDRLVSAVELGKKEGSDSPANPIVPLLIRDAVKRSSHIEAKSLFNPREPFLSGGIALGIILFFVLLQVSGPDFFRYATLKLYANWLAAPMESLYRLDVTPGDTKVRKGSDQLITAQLIGFDSPAVNLYSRYENSQTWEKHRMESQKGSNAFGFLFLDINEKAHYYVQAGNVKSSEFAITVMDVAQVEKINLAYNFPRYTGLPAKREEDGGEISALKGTQVDVEAITNVDVSSAKILLENGRSIVMQKGADKIFRGRIEVKKDSSYKIELTDFSNQTAVGSHEYPIIALEDQPPLISVIKPGRDKKVTKLEEVLTEIKASDDFGINTLQFHFTVNGGKETVVDLFKQKTGDVPKSISGTHTFFMEEYDLEPGDFITYFAKASDARTTSTSDIYFLEVRPFGKEYSQAQSAGGFGGAMGDSSSVLSARQKEILAATWRLIRDRSAFGNKEYSDNLKLVASSQLKLQQQAKSLSDRIQRRALATRDSEFQKLSDNLLRAIEAMTPAYGFLSGEKPKEAVSPEQTALQHLMRAEAYFREIQVAFGNAGGQGNAAGAQELENLFELELDKLKNQYETLQDRSSNQAGAETDEAAQKLKELARRQQQLNERRRQASLSRFPQSGGSGGSDQQMLQEETEKLARQLERLSRETQNPELLDASQRLKQAAQEMRNSSKNGSSSDSQNRGLQALSRLNDAQQLLDSHQKSSLADDLKRLQSNADQLARQQEKIQSQLEKLSRNSKEDANGSGAVNRAEPGEKDSNNSRQIFQDKAQLKKALDSMEQNLFASAKKAGNQQKVASQKLQSAANSIRDNRIQDRVSQAGELIARGMLDSARQREQSIQGMIEDLKQKIGSAEKSLDSSPSSTPEERLSKALSQTGDLLGSLESLNRRVQQLQATEQRKGGGPAGQGSRQQKKGSGSSGEEPNGQDPSESANAINQGANPKEGQNGKGLGKQTKGTSNQPATARNSSRNQQSSQQGEPQENGQSSNGQSQGNQPQNSQANANSNSSALGGNSPGGETRQNTFDNGEEQYLGGPKHGPAVNFGDRELPAPGQLTPDQVRQFEKEYELRLKEAQEIGKNLRDQQDLAAQVKNMLERMKQMGSMKFLYDAQELERLKSTVIEGFRQLELDVSKNLQHLISKENLHLAKDEEVPELYRKQVEDYYRALSEK
jgi:hypothetical protein